MNGNAAADKSPQDEMETLRKRVRTLEDENARLRGKSGYLDEGVIHWEVEVDAIGEGPENQIFSPDVVIAGCTFRVGTYHWTDDNHKRFNPNLFLVSSPGHSDSVHITYDARLISSVKSKHTTDRTIFVPWGDQEYSMFCCTWEKAVDPAKGFVRDGRFTFVVEIKVLRCFKNTHTSFSSRDPLLSDVVINVGDEKFYVNKMYLAHYSEYFKTMFFSDFAEKDKEEVELKEIEAQEFRTFLSVIYPARYRVQPFDVRAMLRLADFLLSEPLRESCFTCLYAERQDRRYGMPSVTKLQIMEEFRLFEMQDFLVEDAADSIENIKDVIMSTEFKTLTEPLQKELIMKHFKLVYHARDLVEEFEKDDH